MPDDDEIGLRRHIGLFTAAFALIGMVAGGTYHFENRYFTRAEAVAQAESFKQFLRQSERRGLQAELRALERELFEIANARSKRRLTELEEWRGDFLLKEIERIKKEIAELGGRS